MSPAPGTNPRDLSRNARQLGGYPLPKGGGAGVLKQRQGRLRQLAPILDDAAGDQIADADFAGGVGKILARVQLRTEFVHRRDRVDGLLDFRQPIRVRHRRAPVMPSAAATFVQTFGGGKGRHTITPAQQGRAGACHRYNRTGGQLISPASGWLIGISTSWNAKTSPRPLALHIVMSPFSACSQIR